MKKSKLAKLSIVFLSIMLLGFVVSTAGELNVRGDYGTIQDATSAARPGDVIVIEEGVYEEEIRISTNNITFRSAGEPENTTLRGTINIESAYGIVIDGLTVTGVGHGIRVRGECRGADPTLTVKNSFISGNSENGIDFSHGASYQGVTIEDNAINDNGKDGVNLNGIGDDVVLKGNEISGNGRLEATGVGVRIGGQVRGAVIENNTLTDNAFANIHPGS